MALDGKGRVCVYTKNGPRATERTLARAIHLFEQMT